MNSVTHSSAPFASISLMYGRSGLTVRLPARNLTVLECPAVPPLVLPDVAFAAALATPIGSPPLRDLIGRADRVAIAIPDITRPFPGPWLLERLLAGPLGHVPETNVVIVSGTGTHRPNTPEELRSLVGEAVYDRYRVINHNAYEPEGLTTVGQTEDGRPIQFNREFLAADHRIALGYIEPHFMAGFSGGYKALMPGLAGIDAILTYHRAAVIGDPLSTWGRLEGNPTQAIIRAWGGLGGLDFLVNVTMNRERQLTGFFCGDPIAAHEAGCEAMRRECMIPCPRRYPIVITSNNGWPLDQNLYQTVKGMNAAAQVVEQDGLIIAAAECRDGFPAHGNFRELIESHDSPAALLEAIHAPGFRLLDQWQAQHLAMVRARARVALYSTLPAEAVRRAFLEPIDDIAARVAAELDRIGHDAPIAVLPEGFAAVPYVMTPIES